MSTVRVVGIFLVGQVMFGASLGVGQEYPNKPIRVVVPAAGGGADFTARIVTQGISGPLGQPVIVDNRGTGMIQADYLFKSPPDGYSLTIAGSTFWIAPLLQNLPYDAIRDFSPVALLVQEVRVVFVHTSMPVKSIKDLIALAKARPGELNYGSSAIGGPAHLASELFKSMAGVNIVHIPYKGGVAQNTALITGEVQMSIADAGGAMPHVKSGKLRPLAVTSAMPSALLPGLPTVAATLPGFESVGLTGMFAPGKTPAAIITRLNQEIVRFLNLPDVKERFLNAAVEVVASSPDQFAATIKTEIVKTSKLIKEAGFKGN
jgi:tripartite-type tricarboxylate transporter receptor subunit TctC